MLFQFYVQKIFFGAKDFRIYLSALILFIKIFLNNSHTLELHVIGNFFSDSATIIFFYTYQHANAILSGRAIQMKHRETATEVQLKSLYKNAPICLALLQKVVGSILRTMLTSAELQ